MMVKTVVEGRRGEIRNHAAPLPVIMSPSVAKGKSSKLRPTWNSHSVFFSGCNDAMGLNNYLVDGDLELSDTFRPSNDKHT